MFKTIRHHMKKTHLYLDIPVNCATNYITISADKLSTELKSYLPDAAFVSRIVSVWLMQPMLRGRAYQIKVDDKVFDLLMKEVRQKVGRNMDNIEEFKFYANVGVVYTIIKKES